MTPKPKSYKEKRQFIIKYITQTATGGRKVEKTYNDFNAMKAAYQKLKAGGAVVVFAGERITYIPIYI